MKKWMEMIGEIVWEVLVFGTAYIVLGEWYMRLTSF